MQWSCVWCTPPSPHKPAYPVDLEVALQSQSPTWEIEAGGPPTSSRQAHCSKEHSLLFPQSFWKPRFRLVTAVKAGVVCQPFFDVPVSFRPSLHSSSYCQVALVKSLFLALLVLDPTFVASLESCPSFLHPLFGLCLPGPSPAWPGLDTLTSSIPSPLTSSPSTQC